MCSTLRSNATTNNMHIEDQHLPTNQTLHVLRAYQQVHCEHWINHSFINVIYVMCLGNFKKNFFVRGEPQSLRSCMPSQKQAPGKLSHYIVFIQTASVKYLNAKITCQKLEHDAVWKQCLRTRYNFFVILLFLLCKQLANIPFSLDYHFFVSEFETNI